MAKGSLRVNGIIVDTDGEIKASTGDAIVIREDDGSAVITVDTSGNTLINGDTFIGGNTAAETLVAGTPRVQLEGLGYADSSLSIFNNSNDSLGSYLYFGKSRGTALSADTIVQDGDVVGGMEWVAADGTDRASRIAGIYGAVDGTPGANDTPGKLLFFTTADSNNSGTERMVIKEDGNVGIGTNDPGHLLHVVQTATSGMGLLVTRNLASGSTDNVVAKVHQNNSGDDQTAMEIRQDGTGDIFTLHDDSTEVFTVLDGGNIGIGTTGPEHIMHIADVGENSFNTKAVFDLEGTRRSGYTQSALELAPASSGGTFRTRAIAAELVSDQSASELVFYSESTEQMRIDKDGNVGIGTSAPDELLHLVSSTSLKPVLKLENTNDDQHNPQIHLVKNPATGGAEADDDYLGQIDFKGLNDVDASPITFGRLQCVATDVSDGTEDGRVYIAAMSAGTLTETLSVVSGNVGIGESSPAFKLHVAGILGIKDTQPTLTLDRGGAYAWTIRNGDGTGSFPLSTLNVANNAGSPVMTFQDDGDVGIGTTNPSYKTQVVENANDWVFGIRNDVSSGNVYALKIHWSAINPDDNTSKAIEFSTTGGDKFQVYSDGDVKNHDNSYGAISDERIKTDIVDANSQWDDVKAIRVRNFKKKDDVAEYGEKAWTQLGVIAQEVEKVSPKLIREQPPSEWEMEHCGFGKKVGGKWVPKKVDGKDMTVKNMNYSILQMKAFKALQEAMTKIETLEAKVAALEGS